LTESTDGFLAMVLSMTERLVLDAVEAGVAALENGGPAA
jgi:hypothetical protein